jgi:hypothetical protein
MVICLSMVIFIGGIYIIYYFLGKRKYVSVGEASNKILVDCLSVRKIPSKINIGLIMVEIPFVDRVEELCF